MGFFQRMFKKVEEVNRGEAAAAELESEMVLISKEDAYDFWIQMAQNILVNAVNATGTTVDRAFVILDFRNEPAFELFYQQNGSLLMWDKLDDKSITEKIRTQLLPQAPDVTDAINENFRAAGHVPIAHAELQFEWATKAWFSHIIWADGEHADIQRDELLRNWFARMEIETANVPLDSDQKLSWYPE
ncbi:hypothetical protein ACTSEZ_11630 [Metabacillus sp. JX24]|uniref:hypothetical protein n=1 Tax=Metabacillus sp. JX24 TaxID=3240759 RepID=UPI00350ECBF3